MIFIVGGRAQGKTGFALTLAGLEKASPGRVADGRYDMPEAAMQARVILHLEEFVRTILKAGEDPACFGVSLIKRNPGAVITADEVGAGIVPLDAFERSFRDAAGLIGQQIAGASEQVYRMTCGIPMLIKG